MDRESSATQIIDLDSLMDVLIDLQIGIRKLSIYSHSHPIIPKVVSGLTGQFNMLFEVVDTFSLGITRGEILYQGAPIAKDNPVIQELAKGLHGLNLAGIAFHNSLTGDEILSFIKMIAEDHSPLMSERAQVIARFEEEVTSISLMFISFKGAIGGQDEEIHPEGPRKDIWKDLVNKLTLDGAQPEAEGTGDLGSDYTLDPVHAAKVINGLFDENKGEGTDQEYEGVIVDYLHEHASKSISGNQRAFHMRKEMGKLFSNLRPDVREQIFRFSLKKDGKDHLAMEGLLDTLPSAALPEVLNQIQVSDQMVSTPMFSLLKKLVSVSKNDLALETQLKSKVKGHHELFNELFVDRSDRLFYPEEYRSLLDEGLDSDDASLAAGVAPKRNTLDARDTNYHLAVILLNMIEGPVFSEEQFEGCVDYIIRLLTEGLGENTQKILMETIKILLKRNASEPKAHHALFQREINKVLRPEFITCLLQAGSEAEREEEDRLLGRIIGVMGTELIPVLLDILEVEESLSVRKRLLASIVMCGNEAIPFVIKKLSSEKWYVIRNMLVLLRDLQAADALPQISPFMQHDAAQIRLAALQTIEIIGANTDTFYQALATSIEDSDPKVRKTAVSFLVSMKDPRAIDIIMKKLGDADHADYSKDHQIYILKAIGDAGGKEWIAVLSSLRKEKPWQFWRWDYHLTMQKEVEAAVSKLRKRTNTGVGEAKA